MITKEQLRVIVAGRNADYLKDIKKRAEASVSSFIDSKVKCLMEDTKDCISLDSIKWVYSLPEYIDDNYVEFAVSYLRKNGYTTKVNKGGIEITM